MDTLKRTPLYERHIAMGAKMVEFGGWEMPIYYPTGIIEEHLATRRNTGLFDISHMGRFVIRGNNAIPFLQHVLTNNAAALDPGIIGSQYTFIPNENGGAVDDAYLYRFVCDEFLLVVNAANRQKDWEHLEALRRRISGVELIDCTDEIVMFALQGPGSRSILEKVIESGAIPEPMRNALSIATINGAEVKIGRTGYTGEPLCFELFASREHALMLWDLFLTNGSIPNGLGARDTLRMEAALPLYGHELGIGPKGKDLPIMSSSLARFAVSFSPLKGDYVGREKLARQYEALKRILVRDYSLINDLPRLSQPVAVTGRGVARAGAEVLKDNKNVGYVTSGTMVPYWVFEGEELTSVMTDKYQLRSICLAYLDSDVIEDDRIAVDIRGKKIEAVVAPYHLRGEAPPYARPILYGYALPAKEPQSVETSGKVRNLLSQAIENTVWRQRQCINLIPSEMTLSPMARLLSVMDPAFRYAEHKKVKAFYDAEVFYYQGTDFISEVELLLGDELRKFLGCVEVETRLISGQTANAAVFSAMVDYLNRTDRKIEQRRMRMVMNNHISKGGHLSAQPMGALRDFVARYPCTEKPAVINFPVEKDNPYRINVPLTLELIDEYRPELIILGKSMFIHKEPVSEIRRFLDEQGIGAVVMYDMAHVLGLVGPHFQQPFIEGADLVTGSTHKTFFGTQRGIVGSRFEEGEEKYELWEALLRRTFPGSVSNHHLGTLLGLLMAAYEMNFFKNPYQKNVIANAKVFARALKESGLEVAGDPAMDYTETHQIVLLVGYSNGPGLARRLEANNIICNYQATPDEESFTASGALRLGVSEMTRFGMGPEDFRTLALLMRDVILHDANVIDQVKALRSRFCELKYCFKKEDYADLFRRLHELVS